MMANFSWNSAKSDQRNRRREVGVRQRAHAREHEEGRAGRRSGRARWSPKARLKPTTIHRMLMTRHRDEALQHRRDDVLRCGPCRRRRTRARASSAARGRSRSASTRRRPALIGPAGDGLRRAAGRARPRTLTAADQQERQRRESRILSVFRSNLLQRHRQPPVAAKLVAGSDA